MTTTRSARIKFKNGFEGTMQLVWEHDKLDGKKYSRRKHFFFTIPIWGHDKLVGKYSDLKRFRR